MLTLLIPSSCVTFTIKSCKSIGPIGRLPDGKGLISMFGPLTTIVLFSITSIKFTVLLFCISIFSGFSGAPKHATFINELSGFIHISFINSAFSSGVGSLIVPSAFSVHLSGYHLQKF